MPRKTVRENPEDKLKNPVNALLFMQGKEMVYKGLDWLDFVRGLGKLSDEQKLERLNSLAATYAAPRVSIRTVVMDEENKPKEVVHTTVPLTAAGAGEYRLTVPDLYRPPPERPYVISDLLFHVESFTVDDHIAWERGKEYARVIELWAEQSKVRQEMAKALPSDETLVSLNEQITTLEAARASLVERQKALFTNLELTPEEAGEQAKRIRALLSLNAAQLKEQKLEVQEAQALLDPIARAKAVAPFQVRLGEHEDQVNRVFMEFVHAYAVREGMTSLALDEWLERAEMQDYSNAAEWVLLGNAYQSRGKTPKRLTREEERRRELRNLAN